VLPKHVRYLLRYAPTVSCPGTVLTLFRACGV
jgi:hypothetical protein